MNALVVSATLLGCASAVRTPSVHSGAGTAGIRAVTSPVIPSSFSASTSSISSSFAAARPCERRRVSTECHMSTAAEVRPGQYTIRSQDTVPNEITPENPLRIVISGGGVGGLMAAKYLKSRGMEVIVFEKTDEFRRFGGPIQLASNALSTIKAIDEGLFEKLMEKFTFTGLRTNGIKDGMRTEWYTKFDAITQAAEQGSLPYTGVVDRPDLQEVLLKELGPGVVFNKKQVVGYENTKNGVIVKMADGKTYEGDVLIGADGIWSQVRAQMWKEPVKGDGAATYSGYTVFAGETVYQPKDYWDVGYKVYIGPGQYFVTSDIGRGRMQWYAFLALPAGTKARVSNTQYLRERFAGWSEEIHEALDWTQDTDVEQRDLYDRPPSMMKSWSDGRATLMGDACHPMMPNLGQGGCQAVEDGFVLTNLLSELKFRSDIPKTLKTYYNKRIIRTSIVQGLSRLASDLIITQFDTPARMTMNPFSIDMPGGMRSMMTSFLQPMMPMIFWAQFTYLYSFAPKRLEPGEQVELSKVERARARQQAEKNWALAREGGYKRGIKQFQ